MRSKKTQKDNWVSTQLLDKQQTLTLWLILLVINLYFYFGKLNFGENKDKLVRQSVIQ